MAAMQAQALRTVYVSSTGSDANPGSERRPFRTIQHAADLVGPGDVVIVEDGVYTGTGTGTPCAPKSRPIVCVARGGSLSLPVTFQARHAGGARLDGQHNASTEGFRLLDGANYVRIEGFEIFGVGNKEGSASGIELHSGGRGSVVADNDIHDVGRICSNTSSGQAGVFLEQPDVTIAGNRIHDIGRFMDGESGCHAAYNAARDHGVYVNGTQSGSGRPGAQRVLITNNVLYNIGRGWPVQLYPGALERPRILNNTFAFASPFHEGHIILGANTSDGLIANNIFYAPKGAAIVYYSGIQTNLQVTNNVIYQAVLFTKTPAGTTTAARNITADPLLVRTTAPFDFHLKKGSPAIGSGISWSFSLDADGPPQAVGSDAGAYAFTPDSSR